MFFRNQYICALADQGVGRGVLDMRASPSLGPISVIFMQFLEKILQNNIFSPPTVKLVPPPPPPSVWEIVDRGLLWMRGFQNSLAHNYFNIFEDEGEDKNPANNRDKFS